MEKPFVAESLLGITAIFDNLLASLSALQSLSGMNIRVAEESTLIHQALDALIKSFGIERSSVILYKEDGRVEAAERDWEKGRVHVWTENEDSSATLSENLQREKALADLAIRSGEPQKWTDECAEPRTDFDGSCLINAPIKVEGKSVGVISMAYPEPGFLNEWHQRLLPLFGNFLGHILTSNRLLVELETEVGKRTQELETLLEESHRMKQHYRNLSLVDELTGLYNRRFFFSESKRTLGLALRYQHPLSLLLLDLDRFKRVNDTFGHAMGDTVLKSVAKALEARLRESDILARIGGEEFAVFLPETDQDGAVELAERLLETIRNLHWQSGTFEVAISASIGVAAMYPDQKTGGAEKLDQEDVLDMLLSQADDAMYAAKKNGGDRAVRASD